MMKTIKRLLAVMMITTCSMISYAQDVTTEYYPIGTTWEEVLLDYDIPQYDSFFRVRSTVVGDTTITDTEYKTIEREITECRYDPAQVGHKEYQFIREQDHCIYFIDGESGMEEERPIYDFNFENYGEEFICQGWLFSISLFDKTEEVLLDGNTYDCLDRPMSNYKIYKTIGQTRGGLIKRSNLFGERTSKGLRLTQFTRNGTLIYKNEIPTPTDGALKTAYQQFAFTFFNKVMGSHEQSIILSPFSAQMALSMLENGAANHTLSEIQETLGTTGYSIQQVNYYNKELMWKLAYRPPYYWNPDMGPDEFGQEVYESTYPIFEIANGIWTNPSIPLYDSFLATLNNYYEAKVGQVDFSSQDGIDEINEWVDEKTHHLIPCILDSPSASILVMLSNVIYFKGSWSNPFMEQETSKGTFQLADGNSIEVDMMHTIDNYHATSTDQFKILKLYYGEGVYSMTIFLPKDHQAMPPLTSEDWNTAYQATEYKTVDLRMPKFDIAREYTLNDILKEMGMVEAFQPTANFSLESPMPMWVSMIKQKAIISVDEKGTEAAAATSIFETSGMGPSEGEEFTLDHPFYFTIENNSTQTILFMGRMNDIERIYGAPDRIDYLPMAKSVRGAGLYDLQGRQLTSLPEKGLYILNGKKFVCP